MRVIKGLSIAILGSLAIAMVISFLPAVQFQSADNVEAFTDQRAFFQNQTTYDLDENNLVDFLLQMPGTHQWEQVSLSENKLSIDILLPANQLPPAEEVYRSLYGIAQTSLSKTRNIQELLVRVRVEHPENPLVLASLVANREDIGGDPELKNRQGMDLNLYLSTHFDFSKTSTWYELFAQE